MAQISITQLTAEETGDSQKIVKIVKFVGQLDQQSVDTDGQLLDKEITSAAPGTIYIFQMGELTYLVSRSLGFFINWHLELEKKQGRILFAELKSNIMDILSVTGLTEVFSLFPTLEAAKKEALK